MKNSQINTKNYNLTEISKEEMYEIWGGSSAFSEIGYWIGRGIEIAANCAKQAREALAGEHKTGTLYFK